MNLLHRVFWPIQDRGRCPLSVMASLTQNTRCMLYATPAQRCGLRRDSVESDPVMMGHSSITQTFDRYGYLFEAREADTAAMSEIAAKITGK